MGNVATVTAHHGVYQRATSASDLYGILAEDVVLYEYDENQQRFGKREVAEYLWAIHNQVFFAGSWGANFEAVDGAVVCLNRMQRPNGEDHACVDIVKFRDDLISEIRICVLRHDYP
jgi:hypothetical protein